jgi:hypothetical protein
LGEDTNFAQIHLDLQPRAHEYPARRTWTHGYLHVTWPHANGYTATCIWIHGYLHMDTWTNVNRYRAGHVDTMNSDGIR